MINKTDIQKFWETLTPDEKYELMKTASGLSNPTAVKKFAVVPEAVEAYIEKYPQEFTAKIPHFFIPERELLINDNHNYYEYFFERTPEAPLINPYTIEAVTINGKIYQVNTLYKEVVYRDNLFNISDTKQANLIITSREGFDVNLSENMLKKRVKVFLEDGMYEFFKEEPND